MTTAPLYYLSYERWSMNYKVNFTLESVEVSVQAGTTLLQAQIEAKLPADAPCGGKGTCGKCTVEYRCVGETAWVRERACQVRVDSDMEVRLIHGGERLNVLTDSAASTSDRWDPMVQVLNVAVPPCPRGDSSSDWTRLCGALNKVLGRTVNWQVSLPVCRGLGKLLATTRGSIWAVVSEDRVLGVSAEEPQAYMAAFDLGTTSIAGYLIHVNGRRHVLTDGMRNPQVKFGGDVISRADYALEHGPEALAICAREAIDGLLSRMCAEASVPTDRIYGVLVAGNTAMHHLFLGISPDSLVHAPYNPVVNEPLSLNAAHCGIAANRAARLYLLPVIGGFVGADTVACLIAGDWLNREKRTLMIDIGTNGELVLGNRDRRLACSTAAGPAFEGAKITCGMRGAEGAIDHVTLSDGEVRWHVIGEGPARGICGSGLVDLVATLLATGELDETGRLQSGDVYRIGDTGVYLTQQDVREVQLAKAAMAAGIALMAERLGIDIEDIQEVDIAGAFGNYIDPDNACAIGLIPECLRDRIVPVGNAAGEGAKSALMDRGDWLSARTLAETTEFLELATLPQFQDEFVDQLGFGDEE